MPRSRSPPPLLIFDRNLLLHIRWLDLSHQARRDNLMPNSMFEEPLGLILDDGRCHRLRSALWLAISECNTLDQATELQFSLECRSWEDKARGRITLVVTWLERNQSEGPNFPGYAEWLAKVVARVGYGVLECVVDVG